MKTVALIAPTGMLGSGVYQEISEHYSLILVARDLAKLTLLDERHGGVDRHTAHAFNAEQLLEEYRVGFHGKSVSPTMQALVNALANADAVINCAGVINRYSREKPSEALFINGVFPHILSRHFGPKLIQITTDCVYDGISGAPYDEGSNHNPTDLYGASKSIGEPVVHSLVLRTSIIGPELHGFVSLLEWVRQQEGATIKGFTKHLWNGITTREFGRICAEIIDNRADYPTNGLFHIFSNDITKFDMVRKIAEKYGINCTLVPDDTTVLDRRLSSRSDLCTKLAIPSFDEMLARL